MQLNIEESVPFTKEGFTLVFKDAWVITDAILDSLRLSYKAGGNNTSTAFYQRNQNFTVRHPTSRVFGMCAADYFKDKATCREKSLYCKMSVSLLNEHKLIYFEGKSRTAIESFNKTFIV